MSGTLTFIAKMKDFNVSSVNYFLGDASWFQMETAFFIYGISKIMTSNKVWDINFQQVNRELSISSNSGFYSVFSWFGVLKKICKAAEPYYNSTTGTCESSC